MRAGILDEPVERVDPSGRDPPRPRITEEQKRTLIRIYESFLRESELSAGPLDAGSDVAPSRWSG